MGIFSPQPRFRIYTSPSSYIRVFKDMFLGEICKGDDCIKLEKEIMQYVGLPFAICVPQARVGIYQAVKASIKSGQTVILSPYTVADVVNMVVCAGGVPLFADIERETCNINPDEIKKLIDNDTGAVLITHLHGLICSNGRILEICRNNNVPLIEDVAQAFGSKLNGCFAGSFGDTGIFSFGRYKNLTSFYGGMVLTPHSEIHEKISAELNMLPYMGFGAIYKRAIGCLAKDIATSQPLFQALIYRLFRLGYLHNIGFINRYLETELDLNRKETIPESYQRRMTPMQARLVLSKIKQVERDNITRIKYARIYHEGLSDLSELILPPMRSDGSHIYTSFPVQYHERNSLVRWLMEHRRDVAVQHLKNCADLPAFKKYFRECPNASAAAREVILLPTYPRYSEREVRLNIRLIREFFRK